jgi:hypothetical protein
MRLRETIEIHCTFGGGGGDAASSTMPSHGHPETSYNRAKQRKGGEDKGGVQGASKKRKKKLKKRSSLKGTSGGQSDGSSLISRNFKVVDGMGRKIHEYKTREEAEQSSAGNRYTRIVRQSIPDSDTPDVRDMIRKRPGDTQVRTFRRSLPFPDSPYPQGPTSR